MSKNQKTKRGGQPKSQRDTRQTEDCKVRKRPVRGKGL